METQVEDFDKQMAKNNAATLDELRQAMGMPAGTAGQLLVAEARWLRQALEGARSHIRALEATGTAQKLAEAAGEAGRAVGGPVQMVECPGDGFGVEAVDVLCTWAVSRGIGDHISLEAADELVQQLEALHERCRE